MELVLPISDTEGIGDKQCTHIVKIMDNLQHTVFTGMWRSSLYDIQGGGQDPEESEHKEIMTECVVSFAVN